MFNSTAKTGSNTWFRPPPAANCRHTNNKNIFYILITIDLKLQTHHMCVLCAWDLRKWSNWNFLKNKDTQFH